MVKKKIGDLLKKLKEGIIEKDEVLELALLSSIAGESIFLLGPPGVAKSLIARRLKFAFEDAKVFEYLMSRFSTPDEIFGPVKISMLKQDKYERVIEGYLPAAEVVFLDEIWKAGPSIQNALLTVINEKIFRNGDKEIKVPMKALISASNELPAKGRGLEALWDRFLIRLEVSGIENPELFNEMIKMPYKEIKEIDTDKDEKISECITKDEYKKWYVEINKINIPDNILNVINVIRKKIEVYNEEKEQEAQQLAQEQAGQKQLEKLYVSDRRWRKILRLIRTSAFLNDRTEADLMDCFLIKHCIWNEEKQIQAVSEFVNDAIEEYGYTKEINFKSIEEEIEKFKKEIDVETTFIKNTEVVVLEPIYDDYYEIINPPDYGNDVNLINKNNYNNLSIENDDIRLFYWDDYYKKVRHGSYNYLCRKGDSEYSIFIDNTEFNLKTMIQGDKRKLTRKPNIKLEEIWDNQIKDLLQQIVEMENQLEQYRDKDLQHLRFNLFVKSEFADIVETHITTTKKKITKIKLEILEIQNNYKKLKDEEVILDA
ncbi:MAG: AAA family ATPase [Treponema sp.]|nr:AAA family ATPase [Treponema sp.]MCL2251811.1 AAA family ATPase [Treponema sp.]